MRIQFIYLAPNEWGNELMHRVAEEHFASLGNPADLVVEVHEHAGWWLSWAIIGGERRCVGTANDQAQFSPEVREWWNIHRGDRFEYQPEIRRDNLVEVS